MTITNNWYIMLMGHEREREEQLPEAVRVIRSDHISRYAPIFGGDTMDSTAWVTAISTVGFPIVACAALFWQNWKMNENHKEEMKKVTEAVENNTKAILNLTYKLEGKNDE